MWVACSPLEALHDEELQRTESMLLACTVVNKGRQGSTLLLCLMHGRGIAELL